jgi:hypothetical protein
VLSAAGLVDGVARDLGVRFAAQDVTLDPVAVLDHLNSGDPGRAGDRSGRDRRANLGGGAGSSFPACFQILPVFRDSHGSTSGGARGMAGRESGAGPGALFRQFFAARMTFLYHTTLYQTTMSLRMLGGGRRRRTEYLHGQKASGQCEQSSSHYRSWGKTLAVSERRGSHWKIRSMLEWNLTGNQRSRRKSVQASGRSQHREIIAAKIESWS